MTLKILKDFNGLLQKEHSEAERVLIQEIKKETIKWVKYRGIKIDSDFCEFHNITEADLQ